MEALPKKSDSVCVLICLVQKESRGLRCRTLTLKKPAKFNCDVYVSGRKVCSDQAPADTELLRQRVCLPDVQDPTRQPEVSPHNHQAGSVQAVAGQDEALGRGHAAGGRQDPQGGGQTPLRFQEGHQGPEENDPQAQRPQGSHVRPIYCIDK